MRKFSIPRISSIELGGSPLDLNYLLTTEFVDIREAASVLPPVIEWINDNLQGYNEQRIAKKQEINEVEARAYMDLRAGLFEERGYGKSTEKAMDHAVALEESVRKVHREFATLSSWCNRLEHLMDALRMKMELTRSSEATRRLVEEHTPTD